MINKELNERIFDVMMEMACRDLMQAQLAEWDAIDTSELEFSPEFEQKMKKLIRSRKNKVRMKKGRRILKRVAAAIIIAMAIGFTITMSVEALRVQFFNTIREFAEEYIGFSFREAEQPSEDDILRPTYVPQGYHESDIRYMQSGIRIAYRNDVGERITLRQLIRQEKADLKLDYEYVNEAYNIFIGENNVTVYEQTTSDHDNYLIWETEDSLYELFGTIHVSELIEMIKSMM